LIVKVILAIFMRASAQQAFDPMGDFGKSLKKNNSFRSHILSDQALL